MPTASVLSGWRASIPRPIRGFGRAGHRRGQVDWRAGLAVPDLSYGRLGVCEPVTGGIGLDELSWPVKVSRLSLRQIRETTQRMPHDHCPVSSKLVQGQRSDVL